jgi:alpha-galactosidase
MVAYNPKSTIEKISHMNRLTLFFLLTLISSSVFAQLQQTKEPPNSPCEVLYDNVSGKIQLRYNGNIIANIQLETQSGNPNVTTKTEKSADINTQIISISGTSVSMIGEIFASNQSIAAETEGVAQKNFPIVRTNIGNPSVNRRNNAIYDRFSDWMIEIKCNQTLKISTLQTKNKNTFQFSCTDNSIEINFRPLFYQKHKGLKYFKPWTYEVKKESITGWCSWWAYYKEFNENDLVKLLQIWKEKQFADFGYRFVQIDDGYGTGIPVGGRFPSNIRSGYYSYGPETWTKWNKELFPNGMHGYVEKVKEAGFSPGVWIGVFFSDNETTEKHPDWFIQDSLGKPFNGPWIGYATNAKNSEAAKTLIQPIFRNSKQAGFEYVKIDQLRHYLYDNMIPNIEYCEKMGYSPDEIFRTYLDIARKEVGKETFMLSCWGVLPQSVGIVDACRIGCDGFGPQTMQQYNSWNGIVWINDPDHCDVFPNYKPAEIGNVTKVEKVESSIDETKLRPSMASIAGGLLMLSDKPEVYQDDNNLEGIKRASPVLPSVPGQLYDYDNSKTSNILNLTLQELIPKDGSLSPIDAEQFGYVCPWWLNEINRNFENWNVLSRMNWTKEELPKEKVNFSDIGIDSNKEYLVFEFWNKEFLGVCKNNFQVNTLQPNGINTFSIREKTNHPQIVSTNRHLSQGGVDLENVVWKNNKLSGKSQVVKNDKYEIYIYIPNGYAIKSAKFNGIHATIINNELTILSFIPAITGEVNWELEF